jgi:hypothetical protein
MNARRAPFYHDRSAQTEPMQKRGTEGGRPYMICDVAGLCAQLRVGGRLADNGRDDGGPWHNDDRAPMREVRRNGGRGRKLLRRVRRVDGRAGRAIARVAAVGVAPARVAAVGVALARVAAVRIAPARVAAVGVAPARVAAVGVAPAP